MTKYYKIGDKFETHTEAMQFVETYNGVLKDSKGNLMGISDDYVLCSANTLWPPYAIQLLGTAPTAPKKPTFEEAWEAYKANKYIHIKLKDAVPVVYNLSRYSGVVAEHCLIFKAACECDDFTVKIVGD